MMCSEDIYRLILYLIGLVSSAMIAGSLLGIRQPLAKMFGGVMTAWALICMAYAYLVWHKIDEGVLSPIHFQVLDYTAVLVGGMPFLLLVGYFILISKFGEKINGPDNN